MLRSAQSLTLCQAANAREAAQVIRSLTQSQATKSLRGTSVVKMFFPLFAAAPQSCLALTPPLKRSAGCQACFICRPPPGGRFFSNQARLRLVSSLGSLRYVRTA
jgi:hypothetical protein